MLRGMSLSLTIYLMKMFASIEKDEDFSFFKPFKKIITLQRIDLCWICVMIKKCQLIKIRNMGREKFRKKRGEGFSFLLSSPRIRRKINKIEKIRKYCWIFGVIGSMRKEGNAGEGRERSEENFLVFQEAMKRTLSFGNDQSAFAMARWKRK